MRSNSHLWLLSVLATLGSGLALAADDCAGTPDGCGKPVVWTDFEWMKLRASQGGAAIESTMQVSRATGDLRFDIQNPASPAGAQATVMMIGGRVFASHGLPLRPGLEISALDGPLLQTMLVTQALTRALPAVGEKQTAIQKVAHVDEVRALEVATPTAKIAVPPPWSLEGTVTPMPDRSFGFSLVLKSIQPDANGTKRPNVISMAGQLSRKQDYRLDDSMPLEGWSLFQVGPRIDRTATGARFDYGTRAYSATPRTVSDVRKQMAVDDSPGKPDPSLKLAGFWKVDCGDSFGVRIRQLETPAMYVVTYCGREGCLDEKRARKTYITGDTHYEVLNAREIKIDLDGKNFVYRKCSDGLQP